MSNPNDPDNDDLDVDNFNDDAGFDDYNKKGTLGDYWRNNPMVKIGVILAAFAIVVGAIILFGGKEEPPLESRSAGGQDVNEAPGSSEISESYRQAIDEKNIEMTEEASRTGGSVLPIPTETTKGALPVTIEEDAGEDPLERWRRMQEERVRQQEILAQSQPPPQPQAPPVDTRTPAVNALSQSMVSQMQAVMTNQKIPKPNFKQITPVGFLEDMENRKMQRLMQQQQLVAATQQNAIEQVEEIIIPAGTIEYGQLLIEANTDAPGPVLAQIVSGPLRGSRVIGSFQSTEEYLVLSFSAVVIDGINYPIQAVAIDPNTTLPGVITEIDRRYFRRVILPMAASFVEGVGDAISDSGSTTVFFDGGVSQTRDEYSTSEAIANGVAEAGNQLSEIIEEEAARTRPMLRVATGTPIGIFFVGPVTDDLARGN